MYHIAATIIVISSGVDVRKSDIGTTFTCSRCKSDLRDLAGVLIICSTRNPEVRSASVQRVR